MHPDHLQAGELLAVPRPDRVRPEQADGTMCVWCDQPPTVDLGVRLSTSSGHHPGGLRRWHPRACQSCAGRYAADVLASHTTRCHACRRQHCPDARALYELSIASRSRPAARRPGR